MLIEGIKFSCQSCIKGHRQANCSHADRELFEVKKRGRPITACETCRQIRKDNNSHKTCTHCIKPDALEPDLVRSLPNGAADPASMALVRRASSVRSRSSASSANHPPLPPIAPGTAGLTPEEDLATVGRKKSVSKSRRKDSTAAQRPHDLSHGHLAHHSTHHSAQFSPYGHSHAHAHPPNHAPLLLGTDLPLPPPHRHYTSPLPRSPNEPFQLTGESLTVAAPAPDRKPSNEELAASFFTRGFDQLEVASAASSSRPDSAIENSAASHSSNGVDSPSSFKEPPRRLSVANDSHQLPQPGVAAGRPVKERKRSGLAQMYGAESDDEGARDATEQKPTEQRCEESSDQSHEVHLFPPYPTTSFNDYASLTSVTEELGGPNYAQFVASTEPPLAATTTFSLPSCDYGVPRSYAPPMAEYSSTAPSAYSAYSGYTPPLARTTSYSVEEEEDPMGALGDLQTQQTDLDILEWIATIAPLPPSSTPASTTGESSSAASSAVPAFEFQHHHHHDVSVSTPTSYPEPPPPSSSVGVPGLAPADFAGLALSPGSSELDPTTLFPLPRPPPLDRASSSSNPAPHRPVPRGEYCSSLSTSTSQSFSQSRGDAAPYDYFSSSDLGGVDTSGVDDARHHYQHSEGGGGVVATAAGGSESLDVEQPPRFDCDEIDLERYGIDAAYFARLGSFEPTATPTSTPVHDAFVGWEQRIERTKGLMLEEFGARTTAAAAAAIDGGRGSAEPRGRDDDEWAWREMERDRLLRGRRESEEEFVATAASYSSRGGSFGVGGRSSSNDSGSRERTGRPDDEGERGGGGGDPSWWV
ncbi:hypothetical protein JCM11491_004214 [Sporobolomyces phaffii]